MLAAALVATALGVVAHGTTAEIRLDFGGERPSPWLIVVLVLFTVGALAPGVIGAGFALAALGRWRRLGPSCRLARVAWIVWVLGPLPVLLLPASTIFRLDEADALKTSTSQARHLILVTAPAIFALVPGALNAALVCVRFLPESGVPSRIVLLLAPFCTIAYLLPLGVMAQIAFHTEIYLGLLLLACSPLVPLVAVRRILQRNSPEQTVRLVRTIGLVRGFVAVLGAALIVGWIVDYAPLRTWIGQIDRIWVLGAVAQVLASKWLTTVVVSDRLVVMLVQLHDDATALAETADGKILVGKLEALGGALK